MARRDGQAGSIPPPEAVQPGRLTALLQEMAEAPEIPQGGAWDQALRPGTVVGRFELVREIGRGGFGVVWEARDRDLGRTVAFKAVRAGGRTAVREERLLREAEAAARLAHPNLVTLFDLGRSEHGPYLVLELLQGRTLEERLAQGSLSVREALRVGLEVAKGVAHAHSQGVVHRDLKPGNVFLCDDGQVKVLDFGLAHAFGQRRQDGGTPAYMAPEQWEGAPEDERTDVFALGVMLHRMLSGELPFPDDGGKAVRGSGKAPALDVAELPALGELVERMLAKRPVNRPRDGGEVAAALRSFQQELERTPSTGSSNVRTRRRPGVRLAGLLAAALLLGGVVAGGVVWRLSRSPPAVGPDGRIVVAVADFANETGEREMDGLSGLLITSLEQSRKLSVLTRSRVLDLAAQSGLHSETHIDERLAREVGRKAGARALILTTIHRFGTAYAVDLRAVAPEKDAHLFTLRERAGRKEEIPDLIDRLGEQVRRELREDETAIRRNQVQVGRAVTSSLEAYEHYLRGLQLWDDCDDSEAIRAFQQALSVDPDMALPHVFLAFMAANGEGGGLAAKPHVDAAARSASSLPDKERRLAEAFAAQHSGRPAEAVDAFRKLAADFPDDKLVAFLAAEAIDAVSDAEAVALRMRAVALDPSFVWPLFRLVGTYAERGQMEALVPLAKRAVEVRPRAGTWMILSLVRGNSRDLVGALEAARRSKLASSRTNYTGSQTMGRALAATDRVDEALAEIEPWTAPGVPEADRYLALVDRAGIEALGGRRGAALRSAEAARAIDTAPLSSASWNAMQLWVVVHFVGGERREGCRALSAWTDPAPRFAAWYEECGLSQRAADLAERLPAGSLFEKLYRVQALRRTGRGEDAARVADEVSAPGSVLPYYRGIALAEAGRCSDAVAELDRFVAGIEYSFGWRSRLLKPLALLEAAKCLDKLDRPAEARRRLDRLLALWSRADADLPALVEAKALRRRLGAAGVPADH